MDAEAQKAKAVKEMFSGIAHRYDFLNHFLSFGVDILWRKKTVALFDDLAGQKILDIACGTGDMAIELANASDSVIVTGVDFSPQMVAIGQKKIKEKKLEGQVSLGVGDALNIEHKDKSFDGVTCAFGVRNFADFDRGISEMSRVLKPGGKMAILEFTTPENRFFAWFYHLYFTRILPIIGGVISGKRSAYTYLPDSVYRFFNRAEIIEKLEAVGLDDVKFYPFTFGVCGVYTGVKK